MTTPSEIASKYLDVRTAAGQRLKNDIEDAVTAAREACARIAVDYAIAAGSGLEARAAERIAALIRGREGFRE